MKFLENHMIFWLKINLYFLGLDELSKVLEIQGIIMGLFKTIIEIFIIFIQTIYSDYAFQEQPQNQSVLIGSNIVLRCSATVSYTKFDLQSQWRTNKGDLLGLQDTGVLPGHRGRYSYDRDTPGGLHLNIQNVSLEDNGNFECGFFFYLKML